MVAVSATRMAVWCQVSIVRGLEIALSQHNFSPEAEAVGQRHWWRQSGVENEAVSVQDNRLSVLLWMLQQGDNGV